MISLREPESDLDTTVDNLLSRWVSTRRQATSRVAADAEFRLWLMRTFPEAAKELGSHEGDDLAHCMVIGAAVDRCVSLGWFAEALALSDWLVEEYVPRGDDLARQTATGAAELYADAGHTPELNAWAIKSLRRMVELVPPGAGTELERATCKALIELGRLHVFGRNVENNRQRTQASIEVCDEIIERWRSSGDAWLRSGVAAAILDKAAGRMEIGEESAAGRSYAFIVESFGTDPADLANIELSRHVYVARHAVDILDTVRIPDPEFKTEYLDAFMRAARREGRDDPEGHVGAPRNYDADLLRLAGQVHHATANLVRRSACWGAPMVLLLRNFELVESSVVGSGPERSYARTVRFADGRPLLNRLGEITEVVQVANTKAGLLGLDSDTASMLDTPVGLQRFLYLPDDGWLDDVRVLIGLAECVVVWAEEKTPAVLQELEVLRELGRTGDTVVLLEQAPAGVSNLRSGGALTVDDPVLAEFPTRMLAKDVAAGDIDSSPFLREVMGPVVAVGRRSTHERVARIRRRLDYHRELGLG